MIKVIDNFFVLEEHQNLNRYCEESLYNVGEADKEGVPRSGIVHEITKDNPLFNWLVNKIYLKEPSTKKYNCYRAYINCFIPNEKTFYHTDWPHGVTCLYYTNLNFNKEEGGETQFLINNEIKGILPIPNRMVIFDATLEHKATSFNSDRRFTIALKME